MSRSSQPLEEWARTAQFSYPVRWGEVEDEVFARPLPPAEGESGADRVIRAIGFVLLALVAIPVFGSAVVGLVLVLLGADPVIIRIAYVLAVGICVAMLMMWWDDRQRGAARLLVTGVTAIASLGAYLVMRSGPEAEKDGWAALLMVAAAVIGLVSVLVIVAGSRPNETRQRRRRWSISPQKDLRYFRARRAVLDILAERSLVKLDDAERKKILEMPLGSWHELDTSGRG